MCKNCHNIFTGEERDIFMKTGEKFCNSCVEKKVYTESLVERLNAEEGKDADTKRDS